MSAVFDSWLIETPHASKQGEFGVLVRRQGYFWFLCPATATLYERSGDTNVDCRMGDSCDWDDLHRRAAQKMQQLWGSE